MLHWPEMLKDFWKWHTKKERIDAAPGKALFHEREIWWCALGTNVGYEQDGRSEEFTRPVVILAKFNLDSCLVVPLTAKAKKGKYYFPVGNISRRMLDQSTFRDLSHAIVKVCFPGLDA